MHSWCNIWKTDLLKSNHFYIYIMLTIQKIKNSLKNHYIFTFMGRRWGSLSSSPQPLTPYVINIYHHLTYASNQMKTRCHILHYILSIPDFSMIARDFNVNTDNSFKHWFLAFRTTKPIGVLPFINPLNNHSQDLKVLPLSYLNF